MAKFRKLDEGGWNDETSVCRGSSSSAPESVGSASVSKFQSVISPSDPCSSGFSDLPDHLLEKILKLLPTRETFCKRTVCRKWRSLLSSPSFLSNRSPWILKCNYDLEGGEVVYLSGSFNDEQRRKFRKIIPCSVANFLPLSDVNFPKSCKSRATATISDTDKGLICMSYFDSFLSRVMEIAVFNPLNGSIRILPAFPKTASDGTIRIDALKLVVGVVGKSHTYRVYVLANGRTPKTWISVYDSVLNSWILTSKVRNPSPAVPGHQRHSLLVKGECVYILRQHDLPNNEWVPCARKYEPKGQKFYPVTSPELNLPSATSLRDLPYVNVRQLDKGHRHMYFIHHKDRVFGIGYKKYEIRNLILPSNTIVYNKEVLDMWELELETLSWNESPKMPVYLLQEPPFGSWSFYSPPFVCGDLLVVMRLAKPDIPFNQQSSSLSLKRKGYRPAEVLVFDMSRNEWWRRAYTDLNGYSPYFCLYEPRLDTLAA